MKKQSGFTLIELAIVLVIIGLLLGGVLKGQELINSAKVKNLITDFKNTQVFMYGYQDKYRALPGDDALVATHLANPSVTPVVGPSSTIGNGLIDGAWNETADNVQESCVFWQHVRLANLQTGSTTVDCMTSTSTYVPRNAEGGRIGIQSISGNPAFSTITNMTGSFVICSDGIQGKLAKQVDVTLDDGNTATGNVRVIASGTSGPAAATIAVADSGAYTVCYSF